MTRRIDPEPVTIFAAIVATYAATVATINYIKSHHKPLPSVVRAKLLKQLTELDDHAKKLRAEVAIVEDIFKNAKYASAKSIRLGNGAQLTASDFSRYMEVSDSIIGRFREVNKLTLQMEREATKATSLQLGPTVNVLGDVYSKLEHLLEARNLSQERAWTDLRAISDGLDSAITELRKQLSAPPRGDA